MEWITLKKDHDSLKKDFFNHLSYRWKKELSKSKTIWIMTTLLLMIVIYIIIFMRSYGVTDLIFASTIALCILYYPTAFIFQKIQIMRWLKRLNEETPEDYQFKFDENGYSYKTEKYTTELKWNYFESYEINEKEAVIYLYTKNKRLGDIMSSRLLTNGNFEKILVLIQANVTLRSD
ncbi:MAG TPA: hypothetical protein VK173_01345 [Lacibacter sp.]|nr:hypothetical protein [Lacibacter sp.]